VTLKITVFRDVTPCSRIVWLLITNVSYEPFVCCHHKSSTLKREVVGSTEATVNSLQITKYHIAEESNPHVLLFSESQCGQNPGQTNADILRHVRCGTNNHFRSKKQEYVKRNGLEVNRTRTQ
jgi:hypothetical protein